MQLSLVMVCSYVLSKTLSMMREKVKKIRSTTILFRIVVVLKILQHWKWNSFVHLLVFYAVTSMFVHGADYMLKISFDFSIVGPTRCTFVLSLLWIISLYMFRALLAHLQEVLHKQQLVYCMCIMSAGCYQGWNTKSASCWSSYTDIFMMHSKQNIKLQLLKIFFF
jgi:hypothetical protein